MATLAHKTKLSYLWFWSTNSDSPHEFQESRGRLGKVRKVGAGRKTCVLSQRWVACGTARDFRISTSDGGENGRGDKNELRPEAPFTNIDLF